MSQNQISKIYKMIKLVTLPSKEEINNNANNIEDTEKELNNVKGFRNEIKDYKIIPECEQIKFFKNNNDLNKDNRSKDKLILSQDTGTSKFKYKYKNTT